MLRSGVPRALTVVLTLLVPAVLVACSDVVGGPDDADLDIDSVSFEATGPAPSEAFLAGVRDWLGAGGGECGFGSVADYLVEDVGHRFNAGFEDPTVSAGGEWTGDAPSGTCEILTHGGDERGALLSALQQPSWPTGEEYVAAFDAQFQDTLEYYDRSEVEQVWSGSAWVDCYREFDEEDGDRWCEAHYYVDGLLLTGGLYVGADDDEPTPQETADWFAAALGSAGA